MKLILQPRNAEPANGNHSEAPPDLWNLRDEETLKSVIAQRHFPSNEPHQYITEEEEESLEEASRRITLKFDALERMSVEAIAGRINSLIVSGPPGIGKTYTVIDTALPRSRRRQHDGHTPLNDASEFCDIISGGCKGPGLYQSLWYMQNGGVTILDDCDSVYEDTQTLNLIKIATDSQKKRVISWRKQAAWLEQYNMERSFEFRGSLIFLTNRDFEQEIKLNSRDVEHFRALIDRARYLCLTIRTLRDFMIRIRYICAGENGMLQRVYGLTPGESEMILQFIEDNKARFYNLSIRLAESLAQDYLADPLRWKDDAEATKMKTGV